jgi:predicted site-specific integrase-resolvase
VARNQGSATIKEIPVKTSTVVPLMSQSQLAERWRLSESTIERWRTEGKGPVFLKLRGQVRYRYEDIQAFEEKSTRNSTSEAVAS